MKRTILTMGLLAIFMISNCKNKEAKTDVNQQPKTEVNTQKHQKKQRKQQQEQKDMQSGDGWKQKIKLNSGEKWIANAETNQGVLKMQALIKDSPKETLEDYHQLANALNDAKNTVIKECTMEGASHDNLHIWLYPLINRIDNLMAADKLPKARNITMKISASLTDYHSYFK